MKKFWIFAFAAAIVGMVLLSATVHNTTDTNDLCSIPNTAFKDGEHIVYKAYYNWQFVWIPAGEADFKIKENKDTYEITVIGKTYPAYDAFFRVRDYFHSVIDKNTMYPQYFVRIVEEGNYRKFDSISFNQEQKIAISFNGKTRETAKRQLINLNTCTHDLLSILYFLRNTDISRYKVGDKIPTCMLFDEKIYPISVKYDKKYNNYKIKELGSYDVIKVIPDLIAGNVFKEGNLMNIYVSNDNNKLPLLIESPLKVGSAKAVLKSYKGLRYNLTKK